jgi:hypothetical protein
MGNEMKVKKLIAAVAIAGMSFAANHASAAFFQGFETDNSGWNVLGGAYDATRVPSGTNGVTSATGAFHAEATGPIQLDTSTSGSAFTRWGGYNSAFPVGGYFTSTDIYLDPAAITTNDTRFDYSSAVNTPAGTYRRDFVFNAGGYTSGGNHFTISASNNAGRGSSNPTNVGRDPFDISAAGWYTFEHDFTDNGSGILTATLKIKDSSDNVLHSWTLSDPTDVIGATVGGNRYGWFASQEFNFLAIDNTELNNLPEPASLGALLIGGLVLAGRRRRRECVGA